MSFWPFLDNHFFGLGVLLFLVLSFAYDFTKLWRDKK